MRHSERGSAVVEFLLLIIPLGVLAVATISVAWFAFAKTTMQSVAVEASWFLAEADSDVAEVHTFVQEELLRRVGIERVAIEGARQAGFSRVDLLIDELSIGGLLGLNSPELRLASHAANEL